MRLTSKIAQTHTLINLSDYKFILPTAIAILALRTKAGNVEVTYETASDATTFLSRIGFFKYCNLPDPAGITGSNPNTVELSIASLSCEKVYDSISSLISYVVNRETIELMVTELMANIEMHSCGNSAVVGQVVRGKFYLCIADDGIGIHQALTTNPDYASLDEQTAVRRSVEKGVTNGKGRGFGLWSATEVLKANQGSLVLRSGLTSYDATKDNLTTTDKWIGTIAVMVYNLDKPVNYTKVTGLAEKKKYAKPDYGF